jgi:hypothetical protein
MVMRLAEIVLFFKKIRESNQSKFKSNEQTAAPDPLDRNRTHALSAFRTILLMLSLIQSRKRITAKSPNSESVKAELKPLDALAAIAIRKHGVAAVVAKSHDGSEDIQVLASVSSSDQPKELLTSPQPLPSGGLKWIEFVTTRNARTEKDRRMQATQPVLVDPETKIPEILKESQDLLTTYLQHEW